MNQLKLSIGLVPRGAWGNNLREVLSKREWDILKNHCLEKARGKCGICGVSGRELHAHEEWAFDPEEKTPTLKEIRALCPACHGVKHMRNSIRLGYEKTAKAHFMRVNGCGELE